MRLGDMLCPWHPSMTLDQCKELHEQVMAPAPLQTKPINQKPITNYEFVELLRRAIYLYITAEDYDVDAKLTDLRIGELALFIPTELPTERLGIVP